MGVRNGSTSFKSTDSQHPVKLVDGVWKDIPILSATLKSVGIANKPDFDTTNLGWLFPQNDTTEALGFTLQLNHDWVKGTEIRPHIHFIQTGSGIAVFKMQYRVYSPGEAVPPFSANQTQTGYALTYTSGSIHQIAILPAITMTGKTESCLVDIKIWRDDNVVTGDVLVNSIDAHGLFNSFGSIAEYGDN